MYSIQFSQHISFTTASGNDLQLVSIFFYFLIVAQPFDVGLIFGVTGDALEVAQNIFSAHLDESPQQVAGVVEHDAGVAALVNEFGDEVAHAAIAPGKDARVVVVAVALVIKHMLQVADQFTIGSGRDGGLMHMEGTGKASANVF